MSRKKTAKRNIKRQTTTKKVNLDNLSKFEKSLEASCKKLYAEITKNTARLQKKEVKLKKLLNKTETQLKKVEKKLDAAKNKQELNKVKKKQKKLFDTQLGFSKELSSITTSVGPLKANEERLNHLTKLIRDFRNNSNVESKSKKVKRSSRENSTLAAIKDELEFETLNQIAVSEEEATV